MPKSSGKKTSNSRTFIVSEEDKVVVREHTFYGALVKAWKPSLDVLISTQISGPGSEVFTITDAKDRSTIVAYVKVWDVTDLLGEMTLDELLDY